MKNLILSIGIILGLSTLGFSQETMQFDKVEIGTVVNGNLVNVFSEADDSEVVFNNNTIEIKNNTELIVLTSVENLGNKKINNLNVQRYKCKNKSGEVIICSVSDGVVSIFNIETNHVITMINREILG